MARPASEHPTELELELLNLLWGQGPATAREVRDRLATTRDLAPTTVITVMNIMVEKGYVQKKQVNGAYRYSPRVTQHATSKRMMRDLVKRAFGGSASAAIVSLLNDKSLDRDELDQINQLIHDTAQKESAK